MCCNSILHKARLTGFPSNGDITGIRCLKHAVEERSYSVAAIVRTISVKGSPKNGLLSEVTDQYS